MNPDFSFIFRSVPENLADGRTSGSGAVRVVETIHLFVDAMSTQVGFRLLFDFIRLGSLRRNYGENMRHLDASLHAAMHERWSGTEYVKF